VLGVSITSPLLVILPPHQSMVLSMFSVSFYLLLSLRHLRLNALFQNGQAAVSSINTLADLGYPQIATPIITDNSTAVGIANHTVRLKRSKAMDMRYHWIRDRVHQGYYHVTWGPGALNLADYFTKTHPPHHYRAMRSTYVGDPHPFPLPVPRPLRTR